jgi:cytosine/adenosine deaminase-related metal-dependent hydrolase
LKIIKVKYLLTPDKILQDTQIAFEEKIVEIGDNLEKKYENSKVVEYQNSVLLPGFCNPHTHLEFSANRATLSYGDFIKWLRSVITNRETLIPKCNKDCIQKALKQIVLSGTTTIGAISSFGEELEVLVRAPLNVVYFNEIIGSNPAAADILFSDFLERFYKAKKYESNRFQSAVAIHSPYSVHYILAKKAVEIAKKHNSLATTHFMESKAEREWIDSGKGEFKDFFEEFLNQKYPANRAIEFLKLFEGIKTLYTHGVWINEEELEIISSQKASIIHCPISNRLLGNGVLDIEKLKRYNINYSIATDGLSSNYTLNMYEELKAALFMHPNKEALSFAKELIIKSTTFAKELGFNSGYIQKDFDADFQIVDIPSDLQRPQDIYLHIILHTKKPKDVYIKGVKYESK